MVKATDLKSVGLCPRRFESCRLRFFSSLAFWLFSTLVFFILHTHAVHERKTRSKPELCYTTTLGAVEDVASYRGVKLHCKLVEVVVAEWLRRQTRNLLGSARAGSNPADYAFFLSRPLHFLRIIFLFLSFRSSGFLRSNSTFFCHQTPSIDVASCYSSTAYSSGIARARQVPT